MLKIRQSYHGIGGAEGYVWKVYDTKGKKLGELERLSSYVEIGSTLRLDDDLYMVMNVYDSDNPRHEKSEVIYYELEPYTFYPDFEIEYKK